MRYLLALAMVMLAAGCISQETAIAPPKENCSDVGCPVELPTTTSTLSAPKCGDGILEAPEECDQNFPCAKGFCQQCKCLTPTADELVSDCQAECLKNGYKNSSIEKDGDCTYNFGEDDPCKFRCAYRKIFPSTEEGNVCCCRELKYAECKKNPAGGCECPAEEKVSQLCKDLRPKPTNNETTQNGTQIK